LETKAFSGSPGLDVLKTITIGFHNVCWRFVYGKHAANSMNSMTSNFISCL